MGMDIIKLKDHRIRSQYQINEAFLFSDHGSNYLLNGKNGKCIFLSDSLKQQLLTDNVCDDFLFKLVQRGMFDDQDPLCPGNSYQPTFFLINLTDSCNLRCLYCFRDVHEQIRKNICTAEVRELCKEIIAYCRENSISSISIQPWGGEPLLAFDQLVEIDNCFKSSDLNYRISIATNATLITPQKADILHSRNIQVGISLDGTEYLHNLHRPLKSGNGNSYASVIDGLYNLRHAGYDQVGVICTVSKLTVDSIPAIVHSFSHELGLRCVKMNFVKTNPFSPISSQIAIDDAETISRFYTTLIDSVLAVNRSGLCFYERNMCDKIKNLFGMGAGNLCSTRGCMGGRKMVALNRHGDLFPCDLVDVNEVKMGNIFGERSIPQLVKAAEESNPFFAANPDRKCDDCPWGLFCKGGCSAATIYTNNKGRQVDELECRINTILYPMLLELAFNDPEAIRILTDNHIAIT